MGVARTLAVRALSLGLVLLVVIAILVAILGVSGFSERVITATINEELRNLRQALAQRITDPTELENVLAARRQELIESYGLDKPWYYRLPDMIRRVVLLDLGESRVIEGFSGSRRVSDIILERMPFTLMLVTSAVVISTLAGIYIGLNLALNPGSRRDRAIVYLAAISNGLPSWWTGIILLLVFVYYVRLMPPGGIMSSPPPTEPHLIALDIIWHSVLPLTTLVAVSIGPSVYAARTIVLNVAQEDFVSVARARGLPESIILRRHILRAAAPPIVTIVVFSLAGSLGGAILTETIFNWPGMGRLYYDAVVRGDEAIIIALTYMYGLIYVAARLLLEALYLILDPRVRF
ncbi:MAG: ABC transporter permease [Nitrososphaerota archaeon]|nr:ABC transporter permease [Candidatus Calditenuaceae archaeon]MDW8073266.1 ABC transporter permease [Nitrososphaerota archaeon]